MLKSIEGNFDHPEANELLKTFCRVKMLLQKEVHMFWIFWLKAPSIKFWSLWEQSQLIGCGALKFLDENHGEFKSIRVHDNFRGKGYGIKIINHLINEAKNLKIQKLSIETGSGDFFAPARKLFDNCGFEPCPPFAHYKEDINSLYLTKLLYN